MEYFKKLLQMYNQYDINTIIACTKSAINQAYMEEPIIVIWTDNAGYRVNITSYSEYVEYVSLTIRRCKKYGLELEDNMPKVINIVYQNPQVSDIIDIVTETKDKERLEQLSNFNLSRKLHSRK